MKQVEIRDLRPLRMSAHSAVRRGLLELSDDDLLAAVRDPKNGDYLTVNTRSGYLHDGNGRVNELRRRAADPDSDITPDTTVPVLEYTPDLSMFPDID